ncbi:MAG: hypothetical protein H0V80_11565 [Acidobacteria bacterium]|nr:hypothetical protein [Acidobacteriota bacterium]
MRTLAGWLLSSTVVLGLSLTGHGQRAPAPALELARARDEPERVQMRERLVRDLALARQLLDDPPR